MLRLETAGTLGDGRRGWIMAAVVGAEEEVRPNDTVKSNVLLATSHDGTMSVWNGFCATRVVCSNTLRMASDEGCLNRIRHGQNMRDRLEIARDVIAANVDKFREQIGLARLMAERQVDADLLVGYVNRVFRNETSDQLQKRVDTIMALFEDGQGNGQGSLWDLYNGVTEWLNYQRGKNADSRLNSLWFGEGAKVSDRAWGEAVKLIGEMVDDGDGDEV
jgi:phage/plasmid-like protein (TIGR03299 family)